MLAKFQNRINATRFHFSVHVHSLQPWPAGSRGIAVGWQRGKRRRGATKSVLPLPNPDKLGTVVRFNEKFDLVSTLYKAPGADRKSQLGPFKKKCLILAILETDGRTHATQALGRVVIDLSEFASIDGQELRTFAVACNKSIHAAVGEPQLTLTIRCRWNKAGADMTEDEVASMSTDQSGSNLGANLRDFFSKITPAGRKAKRDTEQDLKGFNSTVMETIGEDGDDDGRNGRAPAGARGRGSSDEEGYKEAGSDVEFDTPRGSDPGAWTAENLEYPVAGTLYIHDDDEDAAPRYSGTMPSGQTLPQADIQQQYRQPEQRGSSGGRFRVESLAPGPTPFGAPPVGYPAKEEARIRQKPKKSTATQTDPSDAFTLAREGVEDSTMQDELLLAAAQEFAIYNAKRSLRPGRSMARAVHAPARRIARTLVCLGRQDGTPFGHLALRQIKATVLSDRSETQLLAFWWTNTCHLRGFLQSLNLAVAGSGAGNEMQLHWAAKLFVPKLLAQEKFIFDELVSYMWTHTLVPRVAASKARAPVPVTGSINKRAAHEAALRKWVEALDQVNNTLKGLGRTGHVATLRHQVLLDLLKRMDILLFHYLITVPCDQVSMSDAASESETPDAAATPTGPLMDPRNPNMPMLDDSMLFFQRGVLNFGTGMNLKMACTRFQQWAFGDGELREIWSALPEQGQSLFPLLRGASDLMMMPKDLLLDASIREDMCANLDFATMVYMLSRFQADDFASDGIPADILSALRTEAVAAGIDPSQPPQLQVEAECTYYSPTDDMVMEQVEVGEEPGLEYDADSEDELDQLSALHCESDSGLQPPLRFKLLHNLWSQGVPRSRHMTLDRKPMEGSVSKLNSGTNF